MASFASALNSGFTIRLFMIGACAGLLAGCADSDRLSNPFSDPFRGDVDRTPTASISEPTQSYAPTHPVESRPLTPPSGGYNSNSSAAYSAPAYQSQHVASRGWTGSDTQMKPVHQNIAGWTAEGGMPVVVAYGESAEIIARRYGIPTEALVRTNGYASAGQIRPGAHIVIPTYNAGLAASSGVGFSAAHEEQRRAEARLHAEHLHFVRGPDPADTRRSRIAEAKERAHEKQALREKQEKLAHIAKSHARHDAEADPIMPVHTRTAKLAPPTHSVDRMPTASLETEHDQQAALASSAPEFRWPARGRITEGYRRGSNDGINIALPEGTAVKAAEAGVVVYAGNEVRGYGNLVLIRHPNGFVTAYADNGELDVKRGEAVRRGQIIAKSGETGNATSPQLHFEVRKGATPVDPTQYLAGL
jgi:murein DD-endopeptidase MepM/ murein hydrolase activator NlpD